MADDSQGKAQGAQKAAILLMSLGESAAASVLKLMGPKEVQKIGMAMASLSNISRDRVQETLSEFVQKVQQETPLGVGGDEYIRNVLTGALGEEKANGMIDRILLGGNTKGLESLKWMDARSIYDLIRLEHPQILAIVLSYLDGDQSAAVLAEFPEKVRADVLMRIASMDGVQPQAMQELNEILENQLRGGSASAKSSGIGGLKAAANILNFMESSSETVILDHMRELDAELGQQVQDLMFVFDNLVEVDDRGVQSLLREVSTDTLVLALRGADEKVKTKFLSNMSQRAAEMLRDDLENRGPVRLSEVETAQKEILAVARRLAEEGQIVLGGAGAEPMV